MALPKAFFDEDTLVVAAAAFETSSVVAAKGAPVPQPSGKVLSLEFTENVSNFGIYFNFYICEMYSENTLFNQIDGAANQTCNY